MSKQRIFLAGILVLALAGVLAPAAQEPQQAQAPPERQAGWPA